MPLAALSARREAGGGLLLIGLDVDGETARAYSSPGQYVEVKVHGARGYFVLASEVGKVPWELLVKNAGDCADALFSIPLGSRLEVSKPMGRGLAAAQAPSRFVALAVVGSALAVARTVIEARVAQGSASLTSLFLGLRAATDLPLGDEVARWAAAGVSVTLCLSRAELDHAPEVLPGVPRAAGYVQAAVARALDAGSVAPGALVLVAGPNAMLDAMNSFATAHGAKHPTRIPIEVVTNL